MNNQTTHSAKMLKITVSFGWIDYTRQLWDLPYSILCLQKEVLLNTFWQGCLTALNSPDMQCIIQKKLQFFLKCTRSEQTWKAGTDTSPQTMLVAWFLCLHVWLQFFGITNLQTAPWMFCAAKAILLKISL